MTHLDDKLREIQGSIEDKMRTLDNLNRSAGLTPGIYSRNIENARLQTSSTITRLERQLSALRQQESKEHPMTLEVIKKIVESIDMPIITELKPSTIGSIDMPIITELKPSTIGSIDMPIITELKPANIEPAIESPVKQLEIKKQGLSTKQKAILALVGGYLLIG